MIVRTVQTISTTTRRGFENRYTIKHVLEIVKGCDLKKIRDDGILINYSKITMNGIDRSDFKFSTRPISKI